MRRTRGLAIQGLVQVAGVRGLEEARMLRECGADLLGFPLRLPVHAPDLSEPEARAVIEAVGPACCVLITYEDDPSRLVELCRFLSVGIVQVHADVPPGTLARIKALSPLAIIKSYVVGREDLGPDEFARVYAPVCDAFITDTFDPSTGASGATGLRHDWAVSSALVGCSPLPVILAGGLNPDNVREAVLTVRPAAVDVHTGVEAPDGFKDPNRVRAFVQEARAGFARAFPS
ncbi:phosphoribosylanthranilate isomerase [Desulfomicrobium escambiense]|uniref:phosphoribosylanthranilate isomerase n=1 Tax=Desulfomicrobium escambiense TaxID=29503 RepID=UPI0005C198AF|nr:phosphoribosylanthranilate isomerase [Desulfomicrobium escambiense]